MASVFSLLQPEIVSVAVCHIVCFSMSIFIALMPMEAKLTAKNVVFRDMI